MSSGAWTNALDTRTLLPMMAIAKAPKAQLVPRLATVVCLPLKALVRSFLEKADGPSFLEAALPGPVAIGPTYC